MVAGGDNGNGHIVLRVCRWEIGNEKGLSIPDSPFY